jgi:DNA-binding winged helix-turn-helix (wHTH) protein
LGFVGFSQEQCRLDFECLSSHMPQGFSKKNQSSVDTAYRFGDFELHPRDRLLKRANTPIALQPKAFDALLCLVRRAQHLVSKQELINILWPSVHVSEANLTNTIVSLRKIVGRNTIRTVSKHGYRFELPVESEPGVARATFERFARAKELTAQRSLESVSLARDLCWTCLAEDPNFGSAWAMLGRCCWFFDKFAGHSPANVELAYASFQRAFAIDPDLAAAHQFYTFLQVDTGHAKEAMCRLLERLQRHPGEPESLASLVQVFRFCGMLEESIEAHKRAVKMDPAIATSIAHTLFLAGQYKSAIETYGGRAAYYLDAAAWAALGDEQRAIDLLRERLDRMSLSKLMTALMASLLAVLERRSTDAVTLMEAADTTREPEILLYLARHYSRIGERDLAMSALVGAAEAGFICAPQTLNADMWLRPLREHPSFDSLLKNSEMRIRKAQGSVDSFR